MTVTTTLSSDNLKYFHWRHNGDFISDWVGDQVVELTNVGVNDDGIYECHRDKQRPQGRHAIFQLIVRGINITINITILRFVKGILCDFVIITLDQIIVLIKYCTYCKTNLFPKYYMSKHYRTCVK